MLRHRRLHPPKHVHTSAPAVWNTANSVTRSIHAGESCLKGLSCVVISTSFMSELAQGYRRWHLSLFLHRLSRGTHVAAVQRSALRARHPASHHGCTLASLEGWSCRRGRASKRLHQEWPRRMLWCQCSLAMLPRCVYSAAHCTSYSNCNQYSARIGDLRVRPCGPWAASCPVANSVAVCACVHSRGPPSCLPLRA